MGETIDYARRASIGLTRRIPSGTVRMGSRFHPREEPLRSVYVREFEIGHVPVTVSQFSIFLRSGAMDTQGWWSQAGWAWRQEQGYGWGRSDRSQPDRWADQKSRSHHPVTGISYYEAEAYCRWLTDAKKRLVRLPSEEEWERAARGSDSRPFPWGEHFNPDFTNTLECDNGTTFEAGSIPGDTSPFGVHDLAGNIQEWTGSRYTPYPGEEVPPGDLQVVRGGSYNDTAFGARTSYRRGYHAGYFFPYLGFRVIVEGR
jgi:formylglycine-generating enzyme required for sulfatase activity